MIKKTEAKFEQIESATCDCCGQPIKVQFGHMEDHLSIGGYVKENGITLCKYNEEGLEEGSCHMMAEKFHISDGQEWEEGMHPDDLYKMIGSSKEVAIKVSEKL